MLDQLFESFRKTTESSIQMQQEMFKQWTQQWTSTPLNSGVVSAEWVQKFQKRWIEFTLDSLTRHREMLDSMYESGIRVVEQASRLSEAKTPEGCRLMIEELRRKMLETYKDQSEAQLRDFQKGAEKWFDFLPKA